MILELRHNRYLKLNHPFRVIVSDINDAVRVLKILRDYDKYSGWGSMDFDQLCVYENPPPSNDMVSKRIPWQDENCNDLSYYMRGEVSQ